MRNQLKELELPYKEDAWTNYEDYAKQFQSVHKAQLLPNFNFALNRTVILPVVFGGIIILFSFLLFNFINIKNSKTKQEVSETKTQAVATEKPKPQPKKQVIVPVKKEETPLSTNIVTTTLVATPTINTTTLVVKTMPALQTNTHVTNPAVVTNAVAQDTQLAKTIPTYTFEPKRKRRKKGNAEVLESIATPVSLPTVTQEEAEPELR